jgi:hypothetical protein
MSVILTVVVALDAAAVMFAPNPRLWVSLMPALIPLLTIGLILVPMMRGRRPWARTDRRTPRAGSQIG